MAEEQGYSFEPSRLCIIQGRGHKDLRHVIEMSDKECGRDDRSLSSHASHDSPGVSGKLNGGTCSPRKGRQPACPRKIATCANQTQGNGGPGGRHPATQACGAGPRRLQKHGPSEEPPRANKVDVSGACGYTPPARLPIATDAGIVAKFLGERGVRKTVLCPDAGNRGVRQSQAEQFRFGDMAEEHADIVKPTCFSV